MTLDMKDEKSSSLAIALPVENLDSCSLVCSAIVGTALQFFQRIKTGVLFRISNLAILKKSTKMLSTICRRVACNARPLCRKAFSSEVIVTFVDPIQGKLPVAGKVGESLLTVAHDNDIDLEGVFPFTRFSFYCSSYFVSNTSVIHI
jgi:hypothetical protein